MNNSHQWSPLISFNMGQKESNKHRVALIDDEDGMRYIISQHLSDEMYHIDSYCCGENFLAKLNPQNESEHPEVLLLDYNIPGKMTGLEVLKIVKQKIPSAIVIMLTAHGDTRLVVDAMRSGAFDYLLKPCSADEMIVTVERALEHRNLVSELNNLRIKLEDRHNLESVMGSSPEIKRVHASVERVANTNFSVLIQGESGTGKEVVARAIHAMSNRRIHPFVAVDCGAIPSTLIESELFGYEKGAFTGADRRKEGLFEAAQDGTLFLDEIANIPIETQGKLLRALQEKKIIRVGGTQALDINIRIICATNMPLDEASRNGKFRLDLFYRLNEFTIHIPPLCERRDDIVYLSQKFIREANKELEKRVGHIDKSALESLMHYHWPGNVRELKNVIRRAVLMADHEIRNEHLLFDYKNLPAAQTVPSRGFTLGTQTLKEIRKDVEKEAIRMALDVSRGNKSEVARVLDIDYKSLLQKIKEYGLE